MDSRRVASVCLAVVGVIATAAVSMGLLWIWLDDYFPESPLTWVALAFLVSSPIVCAGIVLARVCTNSRALTIAAIFSLAYLSGLALLTIFSLGGFLLPGVAALILAMVVTPFSRADSTRKSG